LVQTDGPQKSATQVAILRPFANRLLSPHPRNDNRTDNTSLPQLSTTISPALPPVNKKVCRSELFVLRELHDKLDPDAQNISRSLNKCGPTLQTACQRYVMRRFVEI
jgi:hypothetical protein